MNEIPVTIITVCRNNALGLEKTIQSVESQTWAKKEFLIIDGASTDKTLDVIKAHETGITQWISEPDQGIYDAMNKGVQMAKGEWVIFMNAGDTFADSNILQRVFGHSSPTAPSTFGIPPKEFDVIYGDVIKGKTIKKAESPKNSHRMFFCHQSAFIKTTCLKEFPFDTIHRMSADFKQIKQLYQSGKSFCQLDFPIANFDTQGVSNTSRSTGLYDNILVIREIDTFLEQVRLLPRLWITYILCKLRGK
ncbi:MAG: glycosyltransferase [Prevotella sp.]|nr:glycosyltransferase [Prevotella sp.]